MAKLRKNPLVPAEPTPAAPDDDQSDPRLKNCIEPFAEQLAAIVGELRELRVVEVSVEYSGSGDSGQVDDVTVDPNSIALPEDLSRRIEDLVYDLLPGGWELNEGSYGTVHINARRGDVSIDHNDIVETSENSMAELSVLPPTTEY